MNSTSRQSHFSNCPRPFMLTYLLREPWTAMLLIRRHLSTWVPPGGRPHTPDYFTSCREPEGGHWGRGEEYLTSSRRFNPYVQQQRQASAEHGRSRCGLSCGLEGCKCRFALSRLGGRVKTCGRSEIILAVGVPVGGVIRSCCLHRRRTVHD